ncbi:hypothetical protein HAX54_020026, partial [Datura stramonium]|nr:hypothetical protein [Datura stramonium]
SNKVEHYSQLIDMMNHILEKQAELRKSIEKMHAKLMEMQAEVETCKDLQVMVLSNTQMNLKQNKRVNSYLKKALMKCR